MERPWALPWGDEGHQYCPVHLKSLGSLEGGQPKIPERFLPAAVAPSRLALKVVPPRLWASNPLQQLQPQKAGAQMGFQDVR